VRRDEVEAIAVAGGEPARLLMVGLDEEVAALRSEVEELKRRLGQNSGNSSLPPVV